MSNYPPGCTQAMHDRHYGSDGVCPRCATDDARVALSSLASDVGADWTDVLKAAADELATAAEENVDEVCYCGKHELKRDEDDD